MIFKSQEVEIRKHVASLYLSDKWLGDKLKIIQDLSVHLSFHLGEIVLIARQKGKYPKPHEMREFLKD